MTLTQKITPCLWFDGNVETAIDHYLSIFKGGRIVTVTRFGDAGPGPKGSVLIATFEIAGQQFIALNGGPQFKFNEAISISDRAVARRASHQRSRSGKSRTGYAGPHEDDQDRHSQLEAAVDGP